MKFTFTACLLGAFLVLLPRMSGADPTPAPAPESREAMKAKLLGLGTRAAVGEKILKDAASTGDLDLMVTGLDSPNYDFRGMASREAAKLPKPKLLAFVQGALNRKTLWEYTPGSEAPTAQMRLKETILGYCKTLLNDPTLSTSVFDDPAALKKLSDRLTALQS